MPSIVRSAAKIGAASLMALSAVALSSGSAQANTYPYDGADPASTYCGGTTSTPYSSTLTWGDGSYAGTVYLRYNSGCRTVWAKIVLASPQDACGNASAGMACAEAVVHRNDDGAEMSCYVPQGATSCYTAMLNDANMSSHAEGFLDTAYGTRYAQTSDY
ncbi:DUF2690 domain-containing protein [Streptacidiphilus pinicola]|nr:DUF2690 domain-containing protein [Streptacidiphilus pinicola]